MENLIDTFAFASSSRTVLITILKKENRSFRLFEGRVVDGKVVSIAVI